MNCKKTLFFLCLMVTAILLTACKGGSDPEEAEERSAVKEQWAYIEDDEHACLKLYEDGTAAFRSASANAGSKLTKYTKYELSENTLKLTAEDGTVTEMKYYDSESGKRYIYQKNGYDFYKGDDSSTLIGAWRRDNGWSFQFTDKGTFLEDGFWAGHFVVQEDGGVLLVYDNRVFDDTVIYYSLEGGKLYIEYPFGMTRMQ